MSCVLDEPWKKLDALVHVLAADRRDEQRRRASAHAEEPNRPTESQSRETVHEMTGWQSEDTGVIELTAAHSDATGAVPIRDAWPAVGRQPCPAAADPLCGWSREFDVASQPDTDAPADPAVVQAAPATALAPVAEPASDDSQVEPAANAAAAATASDTDADVAT
jgi:hypothetical protein